MKGLKGADLKLIALIAMTVDHIGLIMLNNYALCRVVGRLALPIFAYMVAEGCSHTRNMGKYFLRLFTLGLVCQIGYCLVYHSLYIGILLVFAMSVALIYALKRGWVAFIPTLALVGLICFVLPEYIAGFTVDYGFWGVLLPVLIYSGKTKAVKLGLTALGLVLLSLSIGGNQWWSLVSLIPLALYNGERGNSLLNKIFYIYYPAHFIVLYGIYMLLTGLGLLS